MMAVTFAAARRYLRENLVEGLRTSPLRAPLVVWAWVLVFAVAAFAVGFAAGLFRYDPVSTRLAPLLPLTLFVFPSLLEESFFRGVLIPRRTGERGRARTARAVALSTLVFVVWHPLNALTVNRSAIPIFLDPAFLLIVAGLGVVCGYGYVVSRSVWVPVLIHWATVVVWVFLLGGRNLVLEL